MAASEAGAGKAQPWKAHWSPAPFDESVTVQNPVDDSGTMLNDGCACTGRFSQLTCSCKKNEGEKSNRQYMVDGSGKLLIDGSGSGGPGYGTGPGSGFFFELACARKEIKATKRQPWKAHWSPAKEQPASNIVYLADATGELLVDGFHNCTGADMYNQLACSRKEIKSTQVQPWKAHWSPAKEPTSNIVYLADATGELLVDGVCTEADVLHQLAYSRKADVEK